MICCRPGWSFLLAFALFAATATVCATGCDSGQSSASAPPPASSTADDVAADEPAAGPRPKLQPGAGDRPYDKTFDDLRFDIEPGQPFEPGMLPESIEAMAGQRIRIRGFILPTPQKRGIRQFVLVRDNQECCFGPGAALYDCILVEMQPGETAEFSIRPVAVEGTFDIREFRGPDGTHLAIYHLEGESVR
jgi:hypothetical protein